MDWRGKEVGDLNRMSKEAEYRRHAGSLFELAKRAGMFADKFRLLTMAEAWLTLADKIARIGKRRRTHDEAIHPLVSRTLGSDPDHPTAARDVARRLAGTKRFLKSRDERKRVEMRFAHLKIHHGFERMRLRGLSGARDEFHLAAIVQNLKTLALRSIRPPARPHFACAT
jgi:hypothetical protein